MNTKDSDSIPRTCVKDLKAGDTVLQYFLLKSKDVRKTRSGEDYLDLSLSDATGTVAGRVWADAIRKWGQDFNPGDCLKIEGRVESYRDRSQIMIDKIRVAQIDEVPDPQSLVKASIHDPDILFDELKSIADSLEPPELGQLVKALLDRVADSFKTHPAAKMVHHAYRGGLIEHVASVTRKVLAVLELEERVNRSIALAGAILHDIGKVLELDATGQGRTLEGRLIGHVILGVNLIRDVAAEHGVSNAPWLVEIEHIVLSHHGETQFGAPVRPLTREATLVHFMDNLDAKLKIMDEALESADAEGFAPYNKWLEGRAFSGSMPLPEEVNDD
jgi:3'-5' exoribonuclease